MEPSNCSWLLAISLLHNFILVYSIHLKYNRGILWNNQQYYESLSALFQSKLKFINWYDNFLDNLLDKIIKLLKGIWYKISFEILNAIKKWYIYSFLNKYLSQTEINERF